MQDIEERLQQLSLFCSISVQFLRQQMALKDDGEEMVKSLMVVRCAEGAVSKHSYRSSNFCLISICDFPLPTQWQ